MLARESYFERELTLASGRASNYYVDCKRTLYLPRGAYLAGELVFELVMSAAPVFAGIRTQSWDVALTDQGPVFLEVNFGGDLNLAQLANGKGVLDEGYIEHLRECGYRI